MLKALESEGIEVKWIEYENELFLNAKPKTFRDFFDLIFSPQKFYKRLANNHAKGSLELLNDLESNGIDAYDRLVMNVPAMNTENKDFRAYTSTLSNYNHIKVVDVHIYAKHRESDYFDKLQNNLEYIKAFGWEVVCFEMNGLWHGGAKRYDLDLINTAKHKEMHENTMALLNAYGVDEVLVFTLVGNEQTQSWKNAPYFNAYTVNGTDMVHNTDMIW